MASELTSQRGAKRLLWDCETVERSLDLDRTPARERLEAELGGHLTALLLTALGKVDPATPHEEAEAPRRAASADAA